MSLTNLSLDQLKQAISIKEEIAKLEGRLASILGGKTSATSKPAAASKAKGSFTRSPETLARMKAAQQARWAKIKGTATLVAGASAKPAVNGGKAPKKKGGLTPEGRAKLAAAM